MDHFDIEFVEHLIFIIIGVIVICGLVWNAITRWKDNKNRDKK